VAENKQGIVALFVQSELVQLILLVEDVKR
jgi:hypothetical protein